MIHKLIFLIYVSLIILNCIECHSKYSEAANKNLDENDQTLSMKTLEKPFRMAKINMLWSKAKLRLSEPKLKSLFGELKLHDKEEITWKRLRAEGKDKEGLKEAELRRKLLTILNMYGLLEQYQDVDPSQRQHNKMFNEASDDYINKSLFKDKKLNKLWAKAESAGFTYQELQALREEFNHHQDKIDEYYAVLQEAKETPSDEYENSVDEKLERFNSINAEEKPNSDFLEKVNLVREKHRHLRDGFDRLHRMASKGPNSKEFVEPKVEGLWKIALDSDFSPEELESLRFELLHYEKRLLKLRHLQAEAALNEKKYDEKEQLASEKPEGLSLLEDNIKKQSRKVEKLHLNLEMKIMERHTEL